MPNYANAHDLLMCEPPEVEDNGAMDSEDWMVMFIENNSLPGGKDAGDLWERLGEKVGDTDLIWQICRAYHYGKRDEAAKLGEKLGSMLHDTAGEMIDAEL